MREEGKFYRIKLIWFRIRHGLILFSIRNLLLRVGLNINPFYLELEGADRCNEPSIKDDTSLYKLKTVNDSLFIDLYRTLGWDIKKLEESFEYSHMCIGLYRAEKLAALMVIQLDEYTVGSKRFKLKNNEAYLHDMYTYEDYRGKNLAPYLRYLSYIQLREEGRDTCFSITQYFNRSSLRFKKKLNANHLKLYLHLELFKRFNRTFLLKTYNSN